MNIQAKKLAQQGFVHLHALLVLVLLVGVIGGVGAYVVSKSKAYGSSVCYVSPTTVKVNGMTGDYYHVMVQNRTDKPLQLANMKFQATGSNGTATIGYYDTSGKPTENLLKWASGFSGTNLNSYATATAFVRKPVNPKNVDANDYKFTGNGKTYDASCQVIPAGTSFNTQYKRVIENGRNQQYAISCEIIAPEKVIPGQEATFTVRVKNSGTLAYRTVWMDTWSLYDNSWYNNLDSAQISKDGELELKPGESKDISFKDTLDGKYKGTEKLNYEHYVDVFSMPNDRPYAQSWDRCTKNWTIN